MKINYVVPGHAQNMPSKKWRLLFLLLILLPHNNDFWLVYLSEKLKLNGAHNKCQEAN